MVPPLAFKVVGPVGRPRLEWLGEAELPEEDAVLGAGDEAGVVESVKAASDIYAPIAGRVAAINTALEDSPESVNDSPYGEGWFYKLTPENSDDMSSLFSAGDYQKICEEESH